MIDERLVVTTGSAGRCAAGSPDRTEAGNEHGR
jgi:hypothetical protein